MKHRGIILLLAALLLGGGWFWFRATPAGQTVAMFNAPIAFYGKVVDQNGDPVPDANVRYTAVDKFVEPWGADYADRSDDKGLFRITGIKGAALYVEVSKRGYYQIEDSGYFIGYGIPNERKRPSPTDPAIFVLRKMGVAEPLKVFSSGGIRIPKDGKPVEISLTQGHVKSGKGDVLIEVWTQDQQKDEKRRYPWKLRISVPDGGLIQRKDEFIFMAPVDGYEPSVEVSASPADDHWQRDFDGQFFVKLKDGTFARLALLLVTGGDHFVMIESFLNPKPGSRNLEYDPNQSAPTP